ncbi:MAG TPA: hypothetical protein VGI10_18520 [Polyangiaceae bacterium]
MTRGMSFSGEALPECGAHLDAAAGGERILSTTPTMDADLRALGEPDIVIASLSVWIQRREFPDATDYWDGNWLQAVARCSQRGATVCATGPILRTDEIREFCDQCASLQANLAGDAKLTCMEPYLRVELAGNARGQIAVTITLTPDHLVQRHEFRDQSDQSYLPLIVTACRRVLARFPVVGTDPSSTDPTQATSRNA